VSDEARPEPTFRAWAGIMGAAVVAALLIPSGPPGIGLVITGIAIAAAVAGARPRPLDLEAGALTAAALLLLAMGTVYDAPWLIFVDVIAAMGCSAVAIAGAGTWASILAAPFRVAGQSVRVPRVVLQAVPRGGPSVDPGVAARAAGISVVLLVGFGALFVSADAAFARIANELLLPDIGTKLLPARVLVGVLALAGAGGLVLAGRRRAPAPDSSTAADLWGPEPRRPLSTIEWALPLALLDLLFAAFVVVQIAVLFGGHRHVLETTGLTYAEYARAGFFQLVTIAVLVLGVIAASVKVAQGAHRWLKILLGVLCVLTLVVLASALRRMDLYEAAYGLTRIRVAVHAVDLWLAGLFTLVLIAGAGARTWLPRAVLALTVVALLAFNASNPEARIAESGVDRWRATGEIDRSYLMTLSADGVPPLLELPSEVRECILAPIAGNLRRETGPWSSFNLSRNRALDLIPPEEPICSS
jgi:hypothetical protein